MLSKNEKKQKTVFFENSLFQCDFKRHEKTVLPQLGVFFCCFLEFESPSTCDKHFMVFEEKCSTPVGKK